MLSSLVQINLEIRPWYPCRFSLSWLSLTSHSVPATDSTSPRGWQHTQPPDRLFVHNYALIQALLYTRIYTVHLKCFLPMPWHHKAYLLNTTLGEKLIKNFSLLF